MRHTLQELRELGVAGTLFRLGWELRTRTGLAGRATAARQRLAPQRPDRLGSLSLGARDGVVSALADRLASEGRSRLAEVAQEAARGRILCFGRWTADYGQPVDWFLEPVGGRRWDPGLWWSKALGEQGRIGDVKLTWEAARFPQAYHLARAACFSPESAPALDRALTEQIQGFVQANPFGRGLHWSSGQEIAFRLLAWLFARHARQGCLDQALEPVVARSLAEAAAHVEAHLDYARYAVHNNHVLSEALLVYAAGVLLPDHPAAERRRTEGRELLEAQAERQFYADGGYIQQSHNYHRVALQDLLWATVLSRTEGRAPADAWLRAMDRSLGFLLPQQNPADGRLPNYGANDGALPSVLSTCDYADFRPTLQAVSVASRGERVYEPGPWDEEAAWLFGPESLSLPLRPHRRASASFATTGFHVLHGRESGSFGTFRCGTLRDRFSQIDMLHLDVWWRGQNVLADGGSYLYNGPQQWHAHFMRTGSHNTVTVDGRDQMLHYRRFKTLYWTRAKLLRFEEGSDYALAAGEHYGYLRHPGRVVHRRSVLLVKDDLWVVVDRVSGEGEHQARLHWLGGDYPYQHEGGRLHLTTEHGPFSVALYDEDAGLLEGTVVSGREDPPRGWLSRYYGEKRPVPSLALTRRGRLPQNFVSVLGAGTPTLAREGDALVAQGMGVAVRFRIRDGLFTAIQTLP